ncbi:MAG: hypothetical protein ABSG93_14830 [Solirubrobacteraceae bacterium]
MSTRFFSNRDVGQDTQLETLERQQALLLEALRSAGDAPVTYTELRDAGIEFPAGVVSELELAGVKIERCHEDADGSRRVVGVRLDSAHDAHVSHVRSPYPPAPAGATPASAAAGRAPDGLRVLAASASRRSLAPLAFVAAVGVVAALVITAAATGGGHGGHALAGSHPPQAILTATAPTRRSAPTRSARHSQPSRHSQPPRQSHVTPPTPVSAALAAQLESRGHELLQTGQYGEAVPVLRRALAATGENVGGCLQPASEQCLTYAYALYDLGRALMLSGSTVAAVGVLEHRLQIENQRPIVAAELESARRQLG